MHASHNFGGKSQAASFGLKKTMKNWHFFTCKMNVTVIIKNNFKFDNIQMFYTKDPSAYTNCHF